MICNCLLANLDYLRDFAKGPVGVLMFCIGMAGQLVFGSRFVIQWLTSEKKKRMVIPVVFWYLSITGTLLLLSYAIWDSSLIFTLSQSANIPIYVRNLLLIRKHKLLQSEKAAAGVPICADEHCDMENPPGAKFCAFCGRPLTAMQPQHDPHRRDA
jgi:lipid-A-disaccharide synthase-like uncharacterized protein